MIITTQIPRHELVPFLTFLRNAPKDSDAAILGDSKEESALIDLIIAELECWPILDDLDERVSWALLIVTIMGLCDVSRPVVAKAYALFCINRDPEE